MFYDHRQIDGSHHQKLLLLVLPVGLFGKLSSVGISGTVTVIASGVAETFEASLVASVAVGFRASEPLLVAAIV